jgi:hypothetical protein
MAPQAFHYGSTKLHGHGNNIESGIKKPKVGSYKIEI